MYFKVYGSKVALLLCYENGRKSKRAARANLRKVSRRTAYPRACSPYGSCRFTAVVRRGFGLEIGWSPVAHMFSSIC